MGRFKKRLEFSHFNGSEVDPLIGKAFKLVPWLTLAPLIIIVAAVIYRTANYISVTPFIGIGFLLILTAVFDRIGSGSSRFIIYAFILTSPFIVVSNFASVLGDLDRIRHYSDYEANRAQCNRNIIVRSIGEYYLAVDPDDRRILIDDQCTEKFYLFTGPVGRLQAKLNAEMQSDDNSHT